MVNCCPPSRPAGWLAVCAFLSLLEDVEAQTPWKKGFRKKHKMVAVVVLEWEGSPFFSVLSLFLFVCGGEYFQNGLSADKDSAFNAGDLGLIPGSGRSPGEGNRYPFQYSCLGNPMDRRTLWATVHWISESDTSERLNTAIKCFLLRKILYAA